MTQLSAAGRPDQRPDPSAPPVIGLLRGAYRSARRRLDELTAATISGRRWRRPSRLCPPWCAQDHTCTAQFGYPTGEHRSPVTTWRTPYGVLIATRVEGIDGRARIELRAQVRVDSGDDELALRQGVYMPIAVDLTIKTVLAELAEHAALAQATGAAPGLHGRTAGKITH